MPTTLIRHIESYEPTALNDEKSKTRTQTPQILTTDLKDRFSQSPTKDKKSPQSSDQ